MRRCSWTTFSSTSIALCCLPERMRPPLVSTTMPSAGPEGPSSTLGISKMSERMFLRCFCRWFIHRECHQLTGVLRLTNNARVETAGDAPRPRSVDDWIAMLDQSDKWGCTKIRSLAVEQLQALPMDHVLKIAVWKKYGLDETDITSCYHALGTRVQPLSLAEGRLLDLETLLRLAALRDRVQQGVLSYMREPPPPGSALLPSERARDLICRAFLLEFMRNT